jgi:hypothetical protein
MGLELRDIDINKAIAICRRNGVRVESVVDGKKFYVKVIDNDDERVYDKPVYSDRIHAALNKTWRYWAAKILNKQNAETIKENDPILATEKKDARENSRQ